MKKTLVGVAGLVVMFALLVGLGIVAGKLRIRADLTQERIYTLSAGTKKIVSDLDRKITLKLFFSSSMAEVPPFVKSYAREVEDLLEEYRIASKGKIVVQKLDPAPDSEAEEWAQKYGLAGQPIDAFGQQMYFGLVADAGGNEAVLPVLDPGAQELLEYSITRLVHQAARVQKPVLGVMSTLPVMGFSPPPYSMGMGQQPVPAWTSFRELKADYTIREVQPSVDFIDPEISALILVHPKNLPDKTLYAIDQFVMRGGRLAVFLDPLCASDMQPGGMMQFMQQNRTSDLPRLLQAWGVAYDSTKILADMNAVTRVGNGERVEDNPTYLSLDADNINRKDVLTLKIESILMPLAGGFTATNTTDLTVTPLITSSTKSGFVSSMAAQFGSQALRSEFKTDGVPHDIALRLTGKFKTAFPEGKPRDEETEKKTNETEKAKSPPDLTIKEGKSTIVLVADVDMLHDRSWIREVNTIFGMQPRPFNDNFNLLANIVDQVAGSSELAEVRVRGRFTRPYKRVIAMEEEAGALWMDKQKELEDRLRETQNKLREMQTAKDQNQKIILTDRQKEAIAEFRAQEIRINKELKVVRKNLRRDIDRLAIWVKVLNIAAVPLCISLLGLVLGLVRRFKR